MAAVQQLHLISLGSHISALYLLPCHVLSELPREVCLTVRLADKLLGSMY
jgi:hypothetical protein